MRRLLPLILALAVLGTLASCESAPPFTPASPAQLLSADGRFTCGIRPTSARVSDDRPDERVWSLNLSSFACAYRSLTCVLWGDSIGGRQEYWIVNGNHDRAELIGAIGEVLGWPSRLVDALVSSDTGGELDGDSWYLGPGGALVVTIDDPHRVV